MLFLALTLTNSALLVTNFWEAEEE